MAKRSVIVMLMLVVVFAGYGEDEEETELNIENLIIQLGDPDSYVALKASEKLVEIGEPVVPELVKILSLSDFGNRRKIAFQTLQNIGDPSVKYLVPYIG